jgi:hypothetical protein
VNGTLPDVLRRPHSRVNPLRACCASWAISLMANIPVSARGIFRSATAEIDLHRSPLSHGACKRTCNPRAIATASHPEPRQSAKNRALALCLRLSPSRQRRLLPWPCVVATPRRLRRQHKAAHGFSGYAGAVLDLLHFVARRRLTALKRTATMPGRVGHKRQVSSRCSTAPSRAGVNRKRLNITAHYPKYASRCAGLRLVAYRCAPCGFG